MAKDRIERDELASKLIERASEAEDPLRAMAELLTDFVMEAEVTAKVASIFLTPSLAWIAGGGSKESGQ